MQKTSKKVIIRVQPTKWKNIAKKSTVMVYVNQRVKSVVFCFIEIP